MMSTGELGTTSDVSLSTEERVDQACDEFEAAWKAGERPRIETWLTADQARSERLVLLRELLDIELYWRKKKGERPDPSEYIDQFPERDEYLEVARAFQRAGSLHRRFTPHELHASGGLGAVFKAHDEELNREVALKKIKQERAHDPQSQARFLREAEITGQLEHPGIVPVYSLSRSDDGSPFYAMRFVRGETLQAAITRFHGQPGEPGRVSAGSGSKRKTRGADSTPLAFRQLLLRFIEVCNPIAYAHSRGVLHRDIKPDNIMLGPFGETLVLDWGLTKAVECAPGAEAADPASTASSSTGTSDTQPGSRIGTLGYMSPEQAAGQHDALGPTSDVYSLGATLYAILTGQRLLAGETDANEILRKTQAGEIPRPRSLRPNVPRPLEAICLKALALRPEDRYPGPRALADDLERWLAGEPVTAWREPWLDRSRRWARRHRTLVTSSVAALVIALVGLGALSFMLSVKNREVAHERDQQKAVTEFLVTSFRKADPEQDGRKVTVAEALDEAVKGLDKSKIDPITQATILNAVGETYRGLGLVREALPVFENALEIRQKAQGSNHPDTLDSMNDLAIAFARAGRLDRATPLFEQVLKVRQRELAPDHPDRLLSMTNLAEACRKNGQAEDAIELLEHSLSTIRAKLGDDHRQTLGTMNNLAGAYSDGGQPDKAIALDEAALKVRKKKFGADHPDTLESMHNLAAEYVGAGRLNDAIPLAEETVKLMRRRNGDDHWATLSSMNLLAGVYDDAGRLDLAVPIYERVLEARREKLGEQHPDTLLSMSNLGIALEHSGQVGRAIPLFENAFEAQRTKRGEDHPDTLRTKNNLGAALLDAGLLDRAISLLGEALNALQTKRSAHHPDTLYTQRNLARAYEKAHRDQDAERLYRGVVEISARAKPRNDQFYSDSLAYLGRCLIHEHKNDEAVPVLRHCLEIKEKTQPGDWTTARARSLLGEALAGQKAYPEAEQLLLSARKELDEKRDKIRPIDRDETLHDAIDRLVRLYEASGKPAEAEMWRKKVAALPAASVGKPPAQPSADTRKSQPAKGPAPPPTTAPNGTKR